MKKIVRGNDFTLRVPVRRIVNGEKQRFPLPACEEIEVNLVNAFRRRKMEYTIGVEDDSLLKVSVHSSEMALGSYALEVKGKLFGSSWRSNEYEQLQLVDNNASGDTEFGETDEGEDSVEMDTALVVLAPVIVIDGDIEVIKDEIANGVRDGAWLPVKAGRDADGNVVLGAVAEGIRTKASAFCSHAEGYDNKASGNYSHAEGQDTTASAQSSHAEGGGTTASGHYSHAEGASTKSNGDYSHAEGANTIASGKSSHAQGFYNYDDNRFVDMVGVGAYKNNKNASVIYVGRGFYAPDDPKNGYQYLLGVGGYEGQEIGNAKSVQEVFADHDSRIAAVEKGGSVKKSKPKIEYVVGRAIKCSLLTCSSNDRVRYVVPDIVKTISLLVGYGSRCLLTKNGDSIKVKFIAMDGSKVNLSYSGVINKFKWYENIYTATVDDINDVITITNITEAQLDRVDIDLVFPYPGQVWYVSNVTLGDDSVFLVTLSCYDVPSSVNTVSPYRKFENGIVVNKRLPQNLGFKEDDGCLCEFAPQQDLIIYKYRLCRTKWLNNLGRRALKKKIRKGKITSGICNIVVKHKNEKKSCYMQTWVVCNRFNIKKRLH